MKITVGELKIAIEALHKLITVPLPIKVSYYLSKTVKVIEEELSHLENARIKLVEKYGEKNEKGETNVILDNYPKFYEELRQILAEEVDINIRPIKLSDIIDVKLSTIDILALGQLLEDDTQIKEE
jgi:hypothetical protein